MKKVNIGFIDEQIIMDKFGVNIDIAKKVAFEYNAKRLLKYLKDISPSEVKGGATHYLPETLVATYHIDERLAKRVADDYNYECMLYELKKTMPMQKGVYINPKELMTAPHIDVELAIRVANAYNAEVEAKFNNKIR